MLGLSPAQIRAYAAKGFLEPERGPRGELRFGFHDLVILRTAGELTAAQHPAAQGAARAASVCASSCPTGSSLTGVRITADGERVVVRDGDAVWNPESGQSLFDFSVADLAEKAAPLADRAAAEARRRDGLTAEEWYDAGLRAGDVVSPSEAKDAYERALETRSGARRRAREPRPPAARDRRPRRRRGALPRRARKPIPITTPPPSTSASPSKTSAASTTPSTPTNAPSPSTPTTPTRTTTSPASTSSAGTSRRRCGI